MKSKLTTVKVSTFLVIGLACLTIIPIFEAVFIIPFLWLPIPIYLFKITLLILVIGYFLPYLFKLFRFLPLPTLAIVLFYLIISISLYYPPAKGRDGFVNFKNIPHEYSSTHWFFLNRINPVFPIDQTGMALISKKDGLTLPSGYISQKPVTNDGWYGIRTERFLVMAVIYGIIMGILTISIFSFIVSKIEICSNQENLASHIGLKR